jgi:hypothetical protein
MPARPDVHFNQSSLSGGIIAHVGGKGQETA